MARLKNTVLICAFLALSLVIGLTSALAIPVKKEIEKSALTNLTREDNFELLTPQVAEAYGSQIEYIEIPVGFHFYKAMEPIEFDNDNVVNARANRPSWLGDMITAMRYIYASRTWKDGPAYNWVLHAFKTIRPAKLLLLSSLQNLDLLYNLVEGDIQKIAQEIQTLEKEVEQGGHYTPHQVEYLKERITEKQWEWSSLKRDLINFQVALGYRMEWQDQLEQLRYASLSGEARVSGQLKLQGEVEGAGPTDDPLNRISYSPAVDRSILRVIRRYLNVDGYYNPKVFSRWHSNHTFQEEVAFDQTSGLLVRDFQNPFDWTNKDSSQDYIDAYNRVEALLDQQTPL